MFGDITTMNASVAELVREELETIARTIKSVRLEPSELLSRCPPGKQKLYKRALNSLLEDGNVAPDAKVKAFVKMEKSELLKDGFKDPRLIQARGPRFNVRLGAYTKGIEDQLKSLLDPEWLKLGIKVPVVAKGHNLEHRAKHLLNIWSLYERAVVFCLDLSRWDMRVAVILLLLLTSFYLLIHPDVMLEELLEPTTNTKGKTTQGIKYRKKHGVTSGCMTTGVGNCVAVIAIVWTLRRLVADCAMSDASERVVGYCTNGRRLCANLESLQHFANDCLPCRATDLINSLALVVGKLGTRAPWLTLYDDGDDHQLISQELVTEQLTQLLPLWWQLCGHKLTVDGVETELHRAQFCQMRVMPSIPTMVPNPWKVVASSLTLTGQWKSNWRAYLKTVWKARAIMHQGVPFLGPLFYRLQKRLRGPLLRDEALRTALMRQDHWLKLSERQVTEDLVYVEPTVESRQWMQDAWGITIEEQLRWEDLTVKEPREEIHYLDSLHVEF